MLEKLSEEIQELQKALHDQYTHNEQLHGDITILHGQASRASDGKPLDLSWVGLEEAILVYLVRMQQDQSFSKSLMFQEAIKHMDAFSCLKAI